MVMRNGNDGADARRWWDDLPPRLRTRVSRPALEEGEADTGPGEPVPLFTTGEIARDLSRLALLFLGIAVANVLFLLVALSFINGK